MGRDAGDDLLSTNQSCLLHVNPGQEVFKQDRFWLLVWVSFLFVWAFSLVMFSVFVCSVGFAFIFVVSLFQLIEGFPPTYLFAKLIHLPGISRSSLERYFMPCSWR